MAFFVPPCPSPIAYPCRLPCSPHLSPPASSPCRPANHLAAYSSISFDGEERREGERGDSRKPLPACFAKSGELRRYYGDGISRLRSRLCIGILYISIRASSSIGGAAALQAEGRGFEPRLVHLVLPAGRLLDSGRPVFRTVNLHVASPRPSCRPSYRRAGRACRKIAPSHTMRNTPSSPR